MKKFILGALTFVISASVFADCNAGSFNVEGISSSGSWSNLVTLQGQKFISYVQANVGLESKAETSAYKALPNSNIIAFEYRSVVPVNLTGSEEAGGWLLNSSTNSNTVTNGSLFAPASNSDGLKLILMGLGNPIPLYQSFESISSEENRIGIYINKQTKQIGYILNGVNKGYKWSFTTPFNDIGFILMNGFTGFASNSTKIGSEVTMELITDYSQLKYQYPSGSTDICGNTI